MFEQMTDNEKRAWAGMTIGSVLGALLWKQHRVWGFILGGALGSGVVRLVAP